MKNPVQSLLDKLSSTEGNLGKRPTSISSDQVLSDFNDYLKWLVQRHVKKAYSEQYLVSGCFSRTKTFKNSAESNAFCRAHLAVAAQEFEKLLQEMRGKNKNVSPSTFKQYSNIIRDYIFDLRTIVEHLEIQKDKNYSFFKGAKNYHVMTFEVFNLSRQLYAQSIFTKDKRQFERKTSQIASIFVLRQALEAKFERLVGVYISDEFKQTPKLRHGFHYEYIIHNMNYFDFNNVDLINLKKVYDWCHEIVHCVYQPLAWQITYAHSICSDLFFTRPTLPNQNWSINNSVRINNVNDMQQKFAKHFCTSYDHGIWSIDYEKPEAECI